MSTNSAALPRLLERVQSGLDVLVTGAPAKTRLLLAEAAEQLRPACRVVEVAADAAGLSLSRLMAQLSGRGDLDAQDDAVLELGFRRLAVPEAPGRHTVLLLNAAQGIQRSALRFLQHVGRSAPDLVMVVTAGAELEALLEEPAFAALLARLTIAQPLECDAPAPALEPVSLPLIAEAVPLLAAPAMVAELEPGPATALPSPAPIETARVARGRGRVWAASGAGMVASLALGAWIGHASAPRTTRVAEAADGRAASAASASATARAAAFAAKIVPADAPAPTPATPAEIVLATPPNPVVSPSAAPALRDATAPGAFEQPVPAEASADAANPVTDPDPDTLEARTPTLSTLPPEAAEPAPAPRAARDTAPPVLAPEQPIQMSGPGAAEGAASARTKLALARPAAPVLDVPVPPSPPKPDAWPRTLHSKRLEPAPKDSPARLAERRTRPSQNFLRDPEAARYDWADQGPPPGYGAPSYGAPSYRARVYNAPPGWYAPPAQGPYIGTYVAGPYGTRMFRYER